MERREFDADGEAQDDSASDTDAAAVAEASEQSNDSARAAADGAEIPSDDPEAVVAALVELRQQHARAVADYQNLRRRQAEERREHARLTLKAAVINYLPVLDDLTRALETVGEHADLAGHPWVEGIRLAQRKFEAVLAASGVQEVAAATGDAFDPQLHEAISFLDGPQGQVVSVVQSGYAIDGLLIRPAMVLVGNGEGAEAKRQEDGGDSTPGSDDEAAEATDEGTRESGKG